MGRGEIEISEDLLLGIGFKKVIITKEESGNEKDFYYYIYKISRDVHCDFSFISGESDASDFLTIKLLEVPDFEFVTAEPLIVMLNILEDNRVLYKEENQDENV